MIAEDDTQLFMSIPPFFMLSIYSMAKVQNGDYNYNLLH